MKCYTPAQASPNFRSLSSSGSAWIEYKEKYTMHGMSFPGRMLESQELPEPLVTPSTKAKAGAHDENISPKTGLHFGYYFQFYAN